MKTILAAVLLAAVSARPSAAAEPAVPTAAAAPTAAATSSRNAMPGESSVALSEALGAIGKSEILGLFAFIAERDSAIAFADLLSRDKRALKDYAKKTAADLKSVGGLSAWDHEVCASLVNFYASSHSGGSARPDEKRMRTINECVLSPLMTMQDVMIRRKK